MARDVVEVVVRFGDTILDVRHIDRDGTFRIGTGPGVDLAVPGHTTFPLVDGAKIRVPVGVVPYEHDGTTTVDFAGARVSLTRRRLALAPLARTRPEWRAPAFVFGSLALHVFVYLLAITLEPFERNLEKQLPRMRYAHVADMTPPEPIIERKAKPEPTHSEPAAAAAASRPRPRVERAEYTSAAMGASAAAAVASVAKSFDDTRVVERVGALREEDNFTEDDTYTQGFGGSRRMGPGETIKTAENYSEALAILAMDVKLCPAKSCKVNGPVPASFVRTHLHEVMPAIYECYQQHGDGPGTIVLEFTIAGDGSVKNSRGSGLGETGACAARVVTQIYFKAIGDNDVPDGKQRETYVRYPLKFG